MRPNRFTSFAGSISLDSEGGLFYSLAGPGFVAQRDFAPFGWADTGLDIGCFTEGGCGNGELASFTTSTFENVALGHGDATVGDNSYVDVAFRGTWSLTSPGARLPDTPDQFALLTAPFSFTGTLIGSIGGRDLFETALTGNGMARVFVARTGPGGWQIEEANAIQYLFADSGPAPVPEPGTLLLGALGLCRPRGLPGRRAWRSGLTAQSGVLDSLDEAGRRITLFDRDAHDPAAARLDGVAPDDPIGGPVGALDQDVGLHQADDLGGRVFVEDDDRVDACERRQALPRARSRG